jgi:hypothetical protein
MLLFTPPFFFKEEGYLPNKTPLNFGILWEQMEYNGKKWESQA